MAAPVSDARLQANRRNAQLSCGPKSAEGKARSRANAVKHGLTGAGVALPSEDAAAVEARFLQLQEDLAPSTTAGALLLNLAALMSVQVERSARREAAALAYAGRHAADEFDLARLAEVDRWFDAIETDPRDHRRRLEASVDGIDRLLGALRGIRDQVATGHYRRWTPADRTKVDAFLGGSGERFPTSRAEAVLLALTGDLALILPAERAKLPQGDARDAYFRAELLALVDAEGARLAKLRAAIDPAIVADDRAEAARRASLVDSPREALLKRYQAAAIGTFLRALRDFHKLEQPEQDEPMEAAAPAEATQPAIAPSVTAPAARPAPVAAPAAPRAESPAPNEAKALNRIERADRILNGPDRPGSDPMRSFTAGR